MAMDKTDKEYFDHLVNVGAIAAKCDPCIAILIFGAILNETGIDIWDLRRLASGDYTLCDGYCQSSL